MNQKEELFNDRLKEIFIGEEIEGKSGFANLMRIKSSYFDKVFSQLNEDIDKRISQFDDEEEFREELYDKLYTFLKKYFSDSGSIYFTYTPLNSKIYEQVYDNQEDVSLFWKTHMLYYVKTDTIWEELEIKNHELDGEEYDIEFDVSDLEGKEANEKKDIEFDLEEAGNDEIVFEVSYTNYGMSDNKVDNLRKELKKEGVEISNDELRNVLSTFRKQNEVDFFINRDAETFLKEQFGLWLKEYLLDEKTTFEENRLKKIKAIRDTAYDIIDFTSQFEEELKKIWNKPKFVLNSNYVISLDMIVEQKNGWESLESLQKQEGWQDQVDEWKELGIVDEDISDLTIDQLSLDGKELDSKYQHLPIDTKYFPDLKTQIISGFDNLNELIDGWLIHSDNYQALIFLLDRFRGDIKSVYTDPPFNKEQKAAFDYRVKYKDSTWITILENRISLAKEMLNEDGSIFVRCDYNGNRYVSLLLDDFFGRDNFRNEFIVKRGRSKAGLLRQFDSLKSLGVDYDNLYWYTLKPGI